MSNTVGKKKGHSDRPAENALGAFISEIDLSSPLSKDQILFIKSKWYEHLVIVFRNQDLSDDNLVCFAQLFGELHSADGAEYGGKPEGLHDSIE